MKRMVDEKNRKKLDELNQVVANPTLAGTEDNLAGLQVGDTKYAIPHLYMYTFGIDGLSDNKDYSVRIITSENYENGTALINGLSGKYINAIMQDNDYKVIPFMIYTLVENDLQVELLYDLAQDYDLALDTLREFTKTVIL